MERKLETSYTVSNLYKYDEFPELHLNSHELYIFGELLDYFYFADL